MNARKRRTTNRPNSAREKKDISKQASQPANQSASVQLSDVCYFIFSLSSISAASCLYNTTFVACSNRVYRLSAVSSTISAYQFYFLAAAAWSDEHAYMRCMCAFVSVQCAVCTIPVAILLCMCVWVFAIDRCYSYHNKPSDLKW